MAFGLRQVPLIPLMKMCSGVTMAHPKIEWSINDKESCYNHIRMKERWTQHTDYMFNFIPAFFKRPAKTLPRPVAGVRIPPRSLPPGSASRCNVRQRADSQMIFTVTRLPGSPTSSTVASTFWPLSAVPTRRRRKKPESIVFSDGPVPGFGVIFSDDLTRFTFSCKVNLSFRGGTPCQW